jgi:hypothetical protein
MKYMFLVIKLIKFWFRKIKVFIKKIYAIHDLKKKFLTIIT